MPAGGSLIFSIPTSIKFEFDSLEIEDHLFEDLINQLPNVDFLENQIDKEKFIFFSKKKYLRRNLKNRSIFFKFKKYWSKY